MKEKIDHILTSKLINQSELARIMKVDKSYLNRKINRLDGFKLLDKDYQKINEIFVDLIW